MPTDYHTPPQLHRSSSALPTAPLRDAYLTSSLLHKAIRRGDVARAKAAALVLWRLRGKGIWRRLAVIAFEDVGIGSPGALVEIVKLATDPTFRGRIGAELQAVEHAVGVLATSPKDRSSDYLICSAISRDDLEPIRELCGSVAPDARLALIADQRLPIAERATAAWYVSGLNAQGERRLDAGDRKGLFRLFAELGVPSALLEATRTAATLTREPITLMIPLLWLELARSASSSTVAKPDLALAADWNGLPLYTLDKHTRIGKRAIDRFLLENQEVYECLLEAVPLYRLSAAGQMAAFYLDAVATSPEFVWERSEELQVLGLETDMLKVGVPAGAIPGIMAAFLRNHAHLDEVRTRLLRTAYGRALHE